MEPPRHVAHADVQALQQREELQGRGEVPGVIVLRREGRHVRHRGAPLSRRSHMMITIVY